jgi:hypothetical protein
VGRGEELRDSEPIEKYRTGGGTEKEMSPCASRVRAKTALGPVWVHWFVVGTVVAGHL